MSAYLLLPNPKRYWEPCQTSKMEHFKKTLNGWKQGWQGPENTFVIYVYFGNIREEFKSLFSDKWK